MLERTNARGTVTTYSYNASRNLTSIRHSDNTPGLTNTYDAFSRVVGVADELGANTYTYDLNSRVTSHDGPWLNDLITYGIDSLGRRTNLAVQGSAPIAYVFDSLNRLTHVQSAAGDFAYSYIGANPLVQNLNRPNGSFTDYHYDYLDRLVSISNRRQNGDVINQYGYAYNPQDMRSSEVVSNGLIFNHTNSQQILYSHNALNQVTNSTSPNQEFGYDFDGNLTRSYTPKSELLISSYDAENRLRSVVFTNGSGGVLRFEHKYNHVGFVGETRSYSNEVLTGTSRLIREGVLVLEERDNGNQRLRAHYWGRGMGGGIGGLLGLNQGSQNYSYLYDGKGNVITVLSDSQINVAAYRYDAFGVLNLRSGTLEQPYQFSTKPVNLATGLIDFGYRFYNPILSRWITRDPLEEQAGPNLYSYVENNALNRFDPYGLWQATIGGGVGWGGIITFGNNSGQINFGGCGGAGEGFFSSFNPNDTGLNNTGFQPGIQGRAGIGGVTLSANVSCKSSWSVSTPIPGTPTSISYGNNGINLSGGWSVLGGGAIGVGGTYYMNTPPPAETSWDNFLNGFYEFFTPGPGGLQGF